jgi:hypothetical protein
MPGDGGIANTTSASTPVEAPKTPTERISASVPSELVERVRRVVWWSEGQLTMTGVFEQGLELALQLHEGPARNVIDPATGDIVKLKPGEPFPPRRGEIRKGRPMED